MSPIAVTRRPECGGSQHELPERWALTAQRVLTRKGGAKCGAMRTLFFLGVICVLAACGNENNSDALRSSCAEFKATAQSCGLSTDARSCAEIVDVATQVGCEDKTLAFYDCMNSLSCDEFEAEFSSPDECAAEVTLVMNCSKKSTSRPSMSRK